MKFEILDTKKAADCALDLLVAPVFSTAGAKKGQDKPKKPAALSFLGASFLENLGQAALEEGVEGELGQCTVMHRFGEEGAKRVALCGVGKQTDLDADAFRKLGGTIYGLANAKRCAQIGLFLPSSRKVEQSKAIQATIEGFQLAKYRFDRHLTKNKPETYLQEVTVFVADLKKRDFKDTIGNAAAMSHGVNIARDLVNEGADVVNPKELATIATQEGKTVGLEVEVLDEKALEKENMNLMLAVARGSMNYTPPRLIRLAYRPKKKTSKHVVLVGKGVCFDTGGLDLKPPAGMRDMKIDMGGAASVLGALLAVGRLKPNVNVTGYMACVENGVSERSYHPGDVFKARNGLSVEIDNTDAEGRLVLADALDYAQSRDDATVIIDIATLTGACEVALGSYTAAVMSDNDKLVKAIKDHGDFSGESFWQLPLNEALREQLKSEVADMKNSGTRSGGAITAGLFLKSFIREGQDWVHLDIAGPATMAGTHAYKPKGATGFPVRTLVEFILAQ